MNLKIEGLVSRRVCSGAALAVAALIAAMALAACGGGGEESGESGSAGAGTTAEKPAGAPIKLMAIETYTEPKSGLEVDSFGAAEAREQAINAAGGIKGRPVEILQCDNKADANLAAECARKAIAEDVVAVIGNPVNATPLFPILAQAKIPIVGNNASEEQSGNSPTVFPISSIPAVMAGGPKALANAGAKKMGIIVPPLPGMSQIIEGLRKVATAAGVETGQAVEVALDTSDFAPVAATALSEGADSVFVVFPGPNQATVIKALRQADSEAQIATVTEHVTPEVIEALGAEAEGLLVMGKVSPASSSAPGIKQFNEELDEYAPDIDRLDPAVALWTAVYMLEKVFEKLDTIDHNTVLAELSKLEGFSTGGILPPYTTTEPSPVPGLKRAFNSSVVLGTIEDGEAHVTDPSEPFYFPFGEAAGG